jgi:2-polyprenyl-3-methyl-5-hydroxy-6-metoxy-1,4-benzoquinol methylase
VAGDWPEGGAVIVKEKVYPWRDELEANKRVLVEWTPPGSRVLEFGCATGYMSRVLRDSRGCRVTGVEISAAAAEQASRFLEQAVVGDVEAPRLWDELRPPYDVAVFGDVLEHLREPEAVLRRCREMLAPDGRLLVSVPNIAHHTMRWELLRGRFDYVEFGILDNTHLRFFTRRALTGLLDGCGFRVEELTFSLQPCRLDRVLKRLHLQALDRALNRAACGALPDVMAFQWLVLARPALPGGAAVPMRPRRLEWEP